MRLRLACQPCIYYLLPINGRRWVQWLGLSRNKVAVSEGAAGSPPFYGESAVRRDFHCVPKDRQTKRRGSKKDYVVQFSGSDSWKKESVLQTQRVHLYPFRTQKLSSAVAKILYGRLYGKIAQCWHWLKESRGICFPLSQKTKWWKESHTNHKGS